jgi:hypothetical protein
MAEFASTGKANAALTTGIIGTSLGGLLALGSNLLGGGVMNNNCGCSENMVVNRYELGQESKIAKLETEVALRDANIFTDQKIADVYERLDTKIRGLEAGLNAQSVYNATNTATINCIQGQVAQLFGLTKLVVPNTSVCPGWGNVTITPSTTTTG